MTCVSKRPLSKVLAWWVLAHEQGMVLSIDWIIYNLLLFCRSQLSYSLIHIVEQSDIAPLSPLFLDVGISSHCQILCFLKGLKINAFWLLPFFNWPYHQFRFIKSEVKVRHDVWDWNKISGAILFRSEIAFSCNGNYYKWNMECGSTWPVIFAKKRYIMM